MSIGPGSFIVLSINHETVPLEEREQYSVDSERVSLLYTELKNLSCVTESLILNTCNRFELYVCLESIDTDHNAVIKALGHFYQLDPSQIKKHAKTRQAKDAVQHLIEVSAGLRSQITGEAEIFGQVKNAYAQCTEFGAAGKIINRIFQKGFQAAKLLRNSTQIGEGQINISNVAVDLSSKIFGNLKDTSVLVLGTGEIGEKTTKALRSRGAKKFGISSRNFKRAQEVGSEWGATPLPLENVAQYISEYDIVIASTVTGKAIITAEETERALPQRNERPLFLIDLGMPRNIEQSCEDLDNVFLYNLDDLAEIADENLKERKVAIEACLNIASQKADITWQGLAKRDLVEG